MVLLPKAISKRCRQLLERCDGEVRRCHGENLQEMAKQEEADYYKDVSGNKMPTGITDEAVLPVSETRKRFADSVSRGHQPAKDQEVVRLCC